MRAVSQEIEFGIDTGHADTGLQGCRLTSQGREESRGALNPIGTEPDGNAENVLHGLVRRMRSTQRGVETCRSIRPTSGADSRAHTCKDTRLYLMQEHRDRTAASHVGPCEMVSKDLIGSPIHIRRDSLHDFAAEIDTGRLKMFSRLHHFAGVAKRQDNTAKMLDELVIAAEFIRKYLDAIGPAINP